MEEINDLPRNVKSLKRYEYAIIYEDVATTIFSKASQMLTKRSIPFSVDDIKEERDAEDVPIIYASAFSVCSAVKFNDLAISLENSTVPPCLL
ncbi:MAG: hypothetical protein U9N41_07690 [Euryarchaeota archaeon]|nr:hypothetical protein [Euryarchaeota archaeon]